MATSGASGGRRTPRRATTSTCGGWSGWSASGPTTARRARRPGSRSPGRTTRTSSSRTSRPPQERLGRRRDAVDRLGPDGQDGPLVDVRRDRRVRRGGVDEGRRQWTIKIDRDPARTARRRPRPNVVTRVDADTITWEVKDRTLDGKPLPDIKEVKMKRGDRAAPERQVTQPRGDGSCFGSSVVAAAAAALADAADAGGRRRLGRPARRVHPRRPERRVPRRSDRRRQPVRVSRRRHGGRRGLRRRGRRHPRAVNAYDRYHYGELLPVRVRVCRRLPVRDALPEPPRPAFTAGGRPGVGLDRPLSRRWCP